MALPRSTIRSDSQLVASRQIPSSSTDQSSFLYPSLGGIEQQTLHAATATQFHASARALAVLQETLHALENRFFAFWLGIYPEAIDWTGAVTNAHVAAALASITSSQKAPLPPPSANAEGNLPAHGLFENDINAHFAHITAYYYNEDAFSIRTQAHDDMLWVALGWLESIAFIHTHNTVHYPLPTSHPARRGPESHPTWHGTQFIPPFAHRARVFYSIVADAWDETLCGGGLTWDPKLEVYKNSITNTQFLAASVEMYLHWPGDDIDSPFVAESMAGAYRKHDPRFLANSMKSHEWLRAVGLRNGKGLYMDGFHVSEPDDPSVPAQCDVLNPLLYTYNQGVILSGLRGLYISTSNSFYLDEGHELIRAVINATYHVILGRDGILAEQCDLGMKGARGCSQDAQTFKGVFIHHMTAFCAPLPVPSAESGREGNDETYGHRKRCKSYKPWIMRSAEAALATRDRSGIIGGSWLVGAGLSRKLESEDVEHGAVFPGQDVWNDQSVLRTAFWCGDNRDRVQERAIRRPKLPRNDDSGDEGDAEHTLETHGSGMAIIRAAYEFLQV